MRHWVFSCKQTSRMISDSMDRKLPLFQRMGIRFHLMMCKLCTQYRKQLLFIRNIIHSPGEPGKDDRALSQLSDDARKRIKKNLLTKMNNGQ